MKALHSRYTAEGHKAQYPLILSQRTTAPTHDTPVLFQEFCLGVSGDQSRIVLRRYFEQFSPANAQWVEYAHSIPAADLIHWIMTHGQLHIECSENAPHTHKDSHEKPLPDDGAVYCVPEPLGLHQSKRRTHGIPA